MKHALLWGLGSLGLMVGPMVAEELTSPGGREGKGRPLPASVPQKDEAARAGAELLQLQQEIRALRARALADAKAQAERTKELGAEKVAVRRTLDQLEDAVGRREKELAAKDKKLKEEEAALERLKEPTAKIISSLRGFLDKAVEHVEAGIPWRLEQRQGSIQQVRDVLSGQNVAPGAALQAVTRIQQEEEALGRLVETTNLELDLGHEKTGVQAFHLGLLALIYANEDGTVLGFVQGGQKLEDGMDAAKDKPEAAEGYLVAVDILRRRRTPSLVGLYLPSLPVRKEGEK